MLGAAAEARHTVTRLRRAIKYWVGLGSRQWAFYGLESRIGEDSSHARIRDQDDALGEPQWCN